MFEIGEYLNCVIILLMNPTTGMVGGLQSEVDNTQLDHS